MLSLNWIHWTYYRWHFLWVCYLDTTLTAFWLAAKFVFFESLHILLIWKPNSIPLLFNLSRRKSDKAYMFILLDWCWSTWLMAAIIFQAFVQLLGGQIFCMVTVPWSLSWYGCCALSCLVNCKCLLAGSNRCLEADRFSNDVDDTAQGPPKVDHCQDCKKNNTDSLNWHLDSHLCDQ